MNKALIIFCGLLLSSFNFKPYEEEPKRSNGNLPQNFQHDDVSKPRSLGTDLEDNHAVIRLFNHETDNQSLLPDDQNKEVFKRFHSTKVQLILYSDSTFTYEQKDWRLSDTGVWTMKSYSITIRSDTTMNEIGGNRFFEKLTFDVRDKEVKFIHPIYKIFLILTEKHK